MILTSNTNDNIWQKTKFFCRKPKILFFREFSAECKSILLFLALDIVFSVTLNFCELCTVSIEIVNRNCNVSVAEGKFKVITYLSNVILKNLIFLNVYMYFIILGGLYSAYVYTYIHNLTLERPMVPFWLRWLLKFHNSYKFLYWLIVFSDFLLF